MKQTELIDAFLSGALEGEAKSLHVQADQIIHYNTPIAERHGDKVILSYTRYSLATGKVQKMITDRVPAERLLLVKGVKPDFAGSLFSFCEGVDKPDSYIARATHMTLGKGYVISIEGGKLVGSFKGKTRTFPYPDVVNSGLLVIEGSARDA